MLPQKQGASLLTRVCWKGVDSHLQRQGEQGAVLEQHGWTEGPVLLLLSEVFLSIYEIKCRIGTLWKLPSHPQRGMTRGWRVRGKQSSAKEDVGQRVWRAVLLAVCGPFPMPLSHPKAGEPHGRQPLYRVCVPGTTRCCNTSAPSAETQPHSPPGQLSGARLFLAAVLSQLPELVTSACEELAAD